MASKPYMTSDDLIKSIKRRALLPTNQNTFTDEDFLALADEEMAMGLVPTILRMHEDYLMFSEDVTVLPDHANYPIPYRAIGNKLCEVAFKDRNNNIYEMTRIGVGDLPYFNYGNINRPYSYYVKNNEVMLVPEKSVRGISGALVMTYYMRPNSLVLLKDVGVITQINTTTGEVHVSSMPTTFGVEHIYDFISIKSPNKTLKFDVEPVSISLTNNRITFDPTNIPETLTVGDHIALAGQTAIPQVPSDLHVLLAHRVATRCLEALGDSEGLQNANAKLGELNQQAEALIDNRVDNAARKVVARHSTLRSGVYNRRTRIRGY